MPCIDEGPSLIVGRKGSAGEVNRVDGPFWPSDVTYYTEHDHKKLDFDYFHYGMLTLNLPTLAKGVKPGINRNEAYALDFPLPPLDEQKRIVAILDAAFDGLARARANVEANLKNAREVFESTLALLFDPELDERLVKKQFDQVCVLQRGFDLPKGLRTQGEFDLVTSSGASDTHNEYKIEGPGVATGRSGSIGNVFYIEGNFWPLNTTLYIKDFCGNVPRYIWYFLRSFGLSRFSSGAGVPTLNRNHVHDEVTYVLRDTNAQKKMVERLDELEQTVLELETNYRTDLTDLTDLRQSLLQKAFAGELT